MALVVAALSGACSSRETLPPPGPGEPRLVVLLAPCTVSTRFLGAYDPAVTWTPNITAMAGDSVVFPDHYTESGQSGIAYASLLTGVQADKHGVFRHPAPLREELVLLPELMALAGFETYFWNAHPMASAELGYGQGVPPERTFVLPIEDVIGEGLSRQTSLLDGDATGFDRTFLHRPGSHDPSFLNILEKVRTDPSYRAFVMSNFSVTHGPYGDGTVREFLRHFPSERDDLSDEDIKRYTELFGRNSPGFQWDFENTVDRLGLSPEDVAAMARVLELSYKANVFQLDRAVGDVLRTIDDSGLGVETLIVLTADHGETLFRDNALFHWTHGMQLAPEVLEVPLLVRLPLESRSHWTYPGVTRSIDVMPTILGLSGSGDLIPAAIDGKDLSKVIRRQEEAPELIAWVHTSMPVPMAHKQFQAQQRRQGKPYHLLNFFPSVDDPRQMWVGARRGNLLFKLRGDAARHWRLEAFDVETDERETTFAHDPERASDREMAAALTRYKARLVDAYMKGVAGELAAEADELERLRALGYVR